MGNSASMRRPKISPGEDALQTLSSSTRGSSQFQDSTNFLNESFLSFDASGDVESPSPEEFRCSELVIGEEESPVCLNFKNLHTSFLASFIVDRNPSQLSRTKSLFDVLNSQRWSLHSQEYVAMCASFIMSILKIYGQCVPQDTGLISQKSISMFHILDDLSEFLSNMKRNNWHVDNSRTWGSTCHNCEINQMVFDHVRKQITYQRNKFCLVCLKFVNRKKVCETGLHIQLRTQLLKDIYPFSCTRCRMRFCKERELLLHTYEHNQDMSVQNDGLSFNALCCFLCRVPFNDVEELKEHQNKSLEHACRKELAMEFALRFTGSDLGRLSDANDNANCITGTLPKGIEATLNEDIGANEIVILTHEVSNSSPEKTKVKEAAEMNKNLYYCSPCSTNVPKANIIVHERGQKHRTNCESWVPNARRTAGDVERKNTLEANQNLIGMPTSKSKLTTVLEPTVTAKEEKKTSGVRKDFCASLRMTASDIAKAEAKSSIEESNDYESAVSYVINNESCDKEILKIVADYLATERERVQKCDNQYVCTMCLVGGHIYFMFGHMLRKHDIAQVRFNEKSVHESQLQKLSSLISLCMEKQKYFLLKLINMRTVQRLIDVVCLEQAKTSVALSADTSKLSKSEMVWFNSNNEESGSSTLSEEEGYLPPSMPFPKNDHFHCEKSDKLLFKGDSSRTHREAESLNEAVSVAFSLSTDGAVDRSHSKREPAMEDKVLLASLPNVKDTCQNIQKKAENNPDVIKSNECVTVDLAHKIDKFWEENNIGLGLPGNGVVMKSVGGCSPSLLQSKSIAQFCNSNTVLDRESLLISKPVEDVEDHIPSVPDKRFLEKMLASDCVLSSDTDEGNDVLSPKKAAITSKSPDQPSEITEGYAVLDLNVLEAIEKYFYLDGVKMETPEGLYLCQTCDLKCDFNGMLFHIWGKTHLRQQLKLKNQADDVLAEKLDILAYLRVKRNNSVVLKGVQKCVLDNNIKCIQFRQESKSLKASVPSPPDLVPIKELNNAASKPVPVQKTATSLSERDQNNPIVIGDSASASLQEEVLQVCAGTDINDIEMECGTCGVVFQIFNDDVEFSVDMHIQNDPQHTLATAVPMERDAQSVAKSSNTATRTEKKVSQSELHAAENRKTVIEAVLSLEDRYVSHMSGKFYCKLCSIQINSQSQFVHHLLSTKHMSTNWLKYNIRELNEKYSKLHSLLKYKFASAFVIKALERIDHFQSNQYPKDPLDKTSSISSTSKAQVENFSAASKVTATKAKAPNQKNLPNALEKTSSKSSTSTAQVGNLPPASKAKATNQKNLPNAFECQYCHVDFSSLSKASRRKHRSKCAGQPPMQYCDICKVVVISSSLKSHSMGRKHTAKSAALAPTINKDM